MKSEVDHSAVQRLLDKIDVKDKLTRHDVAKLRAMYGARFTRALRLALDGRVKKYVFRPSGRVVWVVAGRTREYLIYPYAPYCSCDDFFFAVMDGKAYLCQHLIAWKLASSLGLYELVAESDEMYSSLLREWTLGG